MIDLRPSYRAVLGLATAGLLVAFTGCTGEPTTPSPSATTPAASSGTDAGSKAPTTKVAGGKKDVMEGIPKKDR